MKTTQEEQLNAAAVQEDTHFSAFESSVLEAAKRQEEQILADAKAQVEKKLAEADKDESADKLAAHKLEIENDLRRCLAAAEQESRRQLLIYRKQLVNGVFAETREKLEEYTQTPAYKEKILEICHRFEQEAKDEPVTVYLRKKDMKLADDIKQIFPDCTVKQDRTITLGGVKVAVGHLLHDQSMTAAAAEERKAFLMRCRLHVNPMEADDDELLADLDAVTEMAADETVKKAAKKAAEKAAEKAEEKPAEKAAKKTVKKTAEKTAEAEE